MAVTLAQGWSGCCAVTMYMVVGMHAVLLWADIHAILACRPARLMWACVIELLSPMPQGCSLLTLKTHPAVLARVPAVPISEHPEGASEEALTWAEWPIQEPLTPLASALMTTKNRWRSALLALDD